MVFADNRDEEQKLAEWKNDQTSRNLGSSERTLDLNDYAAMNRAAEKSNELKAELNTVSYNYDGWTDILPNCYFGISFKSNYVGKVSKVSYFIAPGSTLSNYIGNLNF